VHDEIDLGLAPYLARILDEAERESASAVILEINTPGGRLDAALQMRQTLLDSPVRTIAFVNREAFSAGALIALAANEMYLAPGAVIGAATPVTGSGRTADPKTISAVRSTFRSTAEVRERDPRLAEAMVDPSVTIDGLVRSGQLLTLTTTDARAWGYADAVVANRQELLQTAGLSESAIRETAPALAEQLVRFITNPAVASLLMTLGLLLVIADLFSGGGGMLAVGGIVLMAFFFWGHMLAGLAGWEGVALVGLGVALLAFEAFVIPGFGVAGILGIVAFAAGLFVSLLGGEIVTETDLVRAASTVAVTLLTLILGGSGLAWLFLRTGMSGGLVLQARLGIADADSWPSALSTKVRGSSASRDVTNPAGHGWSAASMSLNGARGVAVSELRPGGAARIDGKRIDVVTQGEYLPTGTPLEVVRDENYRRVVRRCEVVQSGATRPTSRSLS
jgi:membrane-bound serine protease (ClpP class)